MVRGGSREVKHSSHIPKVESLTPTSNTKMQRKWREKNAIREDKKCGKVYLIPGI
jgi:hypothetical protein